MADSPLFLSPVHPEPDSPPSPTVDEERYPLLSSPAGGVPAVIDEPDALQRAVIELSKSDEPIAVDTERAQGRRYGSGAYLVQLRKEEIGTFLIDSHALTDLHSLQQAMNCEWILHAADQDLVCMADLGLLPPSVFDTEIASRLLGSERFSLGAITESFLGIRLKKAHQDEDWSKRPLPESWLSYAALDVELLPSLASVLSARLEQLGRMEWARQEFAHIQSLPHVSKPPTWRSLKGLGKLRRPADLAVARELWTVRDELGQKLDIAPGRLLATAAILDASMRHPQSHREMMTIGDFRRPQAKKHADIWWEAIATAQSMPDSKLPGRPKPDLNTIPPAAQWKRSHPEAFTRLEEVRELVRDTARPLAIQPEVVLSPRAQRELAWTPLLPRPRSRRTLSSAVGRRLEHAGARPWQMELVVSQIERGELPLPALQAALSRS